MAKKALSFILVMILLFSIQPVTAGAVESDISDTGATMIQSVSATITAPSVGQKPSYSASVPSGKGYRIKNRTSGAMKNGVEWYNETEMKALVPDSDTIEAGNNYSVTVELEPVSSSYQFDSDNAAATLNGKEAEVVKFINGDGEIIAFGVKYTFSFPDPNLQYITSIAATITEPSPGAAPSYSATVPSGKGYRIKEFNENGYHHGVRWASAKTFQSLDPDTDVFVEGSDYLLELYFEPVSKAYAFDVDHISGTINGKEAAIIKYMAGDKVVGVGLRERYTCPGSSGVPIMSVSCTVTDPAFGKKPSYSAQAAAAATAYYSVYDVTDEYYTNGVHWYNETDKENMVPTSQFESGKEYSVIILLKAQKGYYFSETISGMVNGVSAQCSVNYEDILEVCCTFTCTSGVSMGSIIKGSYTSSALEEYVYPKIELLQGSTVKYTKLCGKNNDSYSFTNLGFGTYTLRISKKNHVTREYTASCQGNISDRKTVNLTICPIGDADLNGKVQAADAMKAYQHAQGKADAQLTDYAFKCADIAPVGNPNGKIQAADAMIIYQQAQGKHPLF